MIILTLFFFFIYSLKEIVNSQDGVEYDELLAQGTFGIVVKCTLHECGQKKFVAQKRNTKAHGALDDLAKEAGLMKSFDHGNIVQFIDYKEIESNIGLLTMEFCEQGTLYHRVRGDVGLTLSDTLGIVLDLACGLHYMHQLHVAHMDFKTLNVLISTGKGHLVAKIADFGQSCRVPSLGKLNVLCGTTEYMSRK